MSYYDNVKEKDSSATIKVSDFLDGHRWKDRVDYVRAASTTAERKRRKLELPAVTPSGVFFGRGKDYLIEHSRLLCLDIDRKDNPHILNFTDLKYQLGNILHTAYAGASVSGIENGVFALIPIKHPALHESHFKAIQDDLQRAFDIRIDKACKDVSRLRFVSYDLNPVWNWRAEPYEKLYRKPDNSPANKPRQMTTYKPRIEGTGTTAERVETCIQMICNTHTDITSHYSDWMKIAFALNSEFGEAGRQYFHEVSQYHPEYDLEEADRKYNQCRQPGRITIASFFEVCKRYGITWKQNAVA
jgi:hypothetical protein